MSDTLEVGDDIIYEDGEGFVIQLTVVGLRECEIVCRDHDGQMWHLEPADLTAGAIMKSEKS